MKRDPTFEEMTQIATKSWNCMGMDDANPADVAEAVYWFAADNHSGQNSNMYKALSISPFRPGHCQSGCEKGSLAEDLYNDLCIHFAGVDAKGVQAWENRSRAAFAMRALKAYAGAKGRIADEGDISMLIADMLHLLREIYHDHAKGAEEWARTRMEDACRQANDFFNDDVDSIHNYQRGDVSMSEELQEELLLFLEDQDKERRTKLEKPMGVD